MRYVIDWYATSMDDFKNYERDATGKWWYHPPGARQRQGCKVYNCLTCGREFPRPPRVGLREGKTPQYCTKKCSGIGIAERTPRPRREKSPQWRGGKRKNRGYVQVYTPGHPRVGRKGYVMEHRLVMEDHLGRYLEPYERVHHLNGIRDDNRIENLELWAVPHPYGVRQHDKHCPTCTCGEEV